MKNIIVLLFLTYCFVGHSQIIDFPDPNFKNALVNTKCVDTDGDNIGDSDADLNNDGEVDLYEALEVQKLDISIKSISKLEGIENFKNMKILKCYANAIEILNLKDLNKLDSVSCANNKIYFASFPNELKKLSCRNNLLDSLDLSNLTKLISLDCSFNRLFHLDLSKNQELKTFEYSSLHYLYKLKSIKFDNNINLKSLFLRGNSIKEINFSETPNLIGITLWDNNFGNLDFSSLKELKSLNVSNSDSTYNVNVNGLTKLIYLDISGMRNLKNIDISTLTSLEHLSCRFNSLEELNISNNINLTTLYCDDNRLKLIDIQNNHKIELLVCQNNLLEYLYIKNGNFSLTTLFNYNPGLKYVCCDEFRLNQIKSLCLSQSQKSAEVNTYCSFTPGGKFYTVQGQNYYDGNTNGCNEQDQIFPRIKYNVSIGSISVTFITNFTGNYTIPVQTGTFNITPIIENPNHFEVTPSSFTITFPSTSDTITQNFCITPKGIFRQTNITVIPLSPPARPGFDASYKIVWENVGNQIESGTLNFTYDETLLDYISATQTADQVAEGIVKWNFTNFLPFEKREITVRLKVNRPTDTPAVNAGDKLYLTASILDNIFTLENTVVGSYDPNDKTCLQGDRIHPNMIGKYVDFLIRFENTGNYAAENVVVKDIIDTKRFDVSSLQITDASHEAYTRIEGNKVEFIFENIQLPFDDANNDGYIAFKIKTLPSLVLGDSLKNLADIYFDYNFPIRTNETQSKIAFPVSTKDIQTDISIYPNPVQNVIYIDTDENWSKAEIFDISGRILRSVSLFSQSIDVSGLESGTYFMRLKDGEKVGIVKFVKL